MASAPAVVHRLLRACAQLPGESPLDAGLVDAGMPWSELPDAAEAHGLAPLVQWHLKQAGVRLPIDVQQRLFGLATLHARANAARFAVLVDVLDAFDVASIRVIVLKGAALAHILYPSPALRPTSDLDLLVDTSQCEAAQRVLSRLGFRGLDQPGDVRFVGHHHLPPLSTVRDGHLVHVEIHRNALSRDVDDSMTLGQTYPSRQAFTVGGRTAFAFGHRDMLRHLSRHAAERASILRLIWAVDIVGYAARFAHEIDWPALRRRDPFVVNALALLHDVTPLPPALLGEIPVSPSPVKNAGIAYRPLREIVQPGRPLAVMLRELFVAPEWWLRFHYGIPRRRSVRWHRWVRHPVRVLWWFGLRALSWFRSRLS